MNNDNRPHHQQEIFETDRPATRYPGPVTFLGMTFENDDKRREYFLDKLREKLKDPEFRKIEGFPIGEDEDILALSDPPYYTACPNPFIKDFIKHYGKPYDPATDDYRREPFTVDVSVGKTDAIYKAHSYHTKVPHLAIVPSLLHYTEPGELVLDGFCGSGMTGVAAQWCGSAPNDYKRELETDWDGKGRGKPRWGARRVVLADLSPAATFIAANYNIPFEVDAFAEAGQRILDEAEREIGWMYRTLHNDGITKARIEYTVWSEVLTCPDCVGEKEIGGWQKYEKPLELSELLEQNFLRYDGKDDVPSQIHSYLSSNFKELRNLEKDDLALKAKAKNRWYVPDPKKVGDLEKLRERALMREFEEYRESKQKRLKVFRLEAVRAGFKKAWQERDYATIIAVASKIPEKILQEDPKLLMWYDQAITRTGE